MWKLHSKKTPKTAFMVRREPLRKADIKKDSAMSSKCLGEVFWVFQGFFCWGLGYFAGLHSLTETKISHLKIGQISKGNNRIPTIHFLVLYVSSGRVNLSTKVVLQIRFGRNSTPKTWTTFWLDFTRGSFGDGFWF